MEGCLGPDAFALPEGCADGRLCPTQAESLEWLPSSRPPAHQLPDGVRQVGVLGDGTPVSVRPLVAADRAWFAEWAASLSDQSKYRRFFSCYTELSARMLDRLVDDVDGIRHVAFVATVPAFPAPGGPPSWPDARTVPVAVGRFIRPRTDATVAELACTVTDAWQGRGVGTLVLRALVIAARALGVSTFTATVLAENLPSLRLLAKAGRVIRREADGAEVELDVELVAPPGAETPARLGSPPRASVPARTPNRSQCPTAATRDANGRRSPRH